MKKPSKKCRTQFRSASTGRFAKRGRTAKVCRRYCKGKKGGTCA